MIYASESLVQIECLHLEAANAYRHAANCANAFAFKAEMTDGTAKTDNQKLVTYWENKRNGAKSVINALVDEMARRAEYL